MIVKDLEYFLKTPSRDLSNGTWLTVHIQRFHPRSKLQIVEAFESTNTYEELEKNF